MAGRIRIVDLTPEERRKQRRRWHEGGAKPRRRAGELAQRLMAKGGVGAIATPYKPKPKRVKPPRPQRDSGDPGPGEAEKSSR